MAEDQKSKAGWLDRRREKKREKQQLRTGPSPEKLAERSKRDEISPWENAARPARPVSLLGSSKPRAAVRALGERAEGAEIAGFGHQC